MPRVRTAAQLEIETEWNRRLNEAVERGAAMPSFEKARKRAEIEAEVAVHERHAVGELKVGVKCPYCGRKGRGR